VGFYILPTLYSTASSFVQQIAVYEATVSGPGEMCPGGVTEENYQVCNLNKCYFMRDKISKTNNNFTEQNPS
jgi:hypothetical protein